MSSIETGDNSNTTVSKEDSIQQRVLGIKLLQAVKEGNKGAAKQLVNNGADITYADALGWQPIHYAATQGFADLIVNFINRGASPNCPDSNGETPLHKAARRGHADTLVVLLAQDAVVGTLNWMGQSSFELGVIARNVPVIELLLMFGAEPRLQDWTWTMTENLSVAEKRILELTYKQLSLMPGLTNGGIKIGSAYVKPKTSHSLNEVGVSVDATRISVPFFIYCRKMQSEYAEFKHLLADGVKLFSDIYECRTWRVKGQIMRLRIVVTGTPNLNEQAYIVSPLGQIGKIEKVERHNGKNETIVNAAIKFASNGLTSFAIAVQAEKENVDITENALDIRPVMEPEALISIPQGTFQGHHKLSLDVVDTKHANEDESIESGAILLTNVIDISISDGMQPTNAIKMKLPMHPSDHNTDDLCVLGTSEDDPESEDDWELIEAEPDNDGSCAVFNINHFSIYVGAKRKMVSEDKAQVVQAIIRSLKRERKVEFLVFTRLLKEFGHFELLVECSVKRRSKKRRRKWEKRGFTMQNPPSNIHVIEENQSFKLNVDGNLREVSDEKDFKLDFVGKRGHKYMLLSMLVCDTKAAANGTLHIDIEEIVELENPVEVVKVSNCFRSKNKVQPSSQKKLYSTYNPYTTVPLEFVLQKEEKEEPIHIKSENDSSEDSPMELAIEIEQKNPSTISALNAYKLANIAKKLTQNEGIHLGYQLLTKRDAQLMADTYQNDVGIYILLKYRGRRPYYHQISSIATAFRAINRKDLVLDLLSEESCDAS